MTCFSEAEKFARIRLLRSDRVGPVSFERLISRFGSAKAALEQLAGTGRETQGNRIAPASVVEKEIEQCARRGIRHVFAGEAAYPELLRETDGAPPVLLAMGDLDLVNRTCISLVGARNASAAARKLTSEWSSLFAEQGTVVVSGLARGIDTAAHRGAMRGREGGYPTIAVIASGHDVPFPPENEQLQRLLCEQALVLSEYPPGTEPRARQFPARNRLIAGLSRATLVMEAAMGSGSLITARQAAEAGREVLAVPGSPLDERARGCNWLIREGATLVQSADDVLDAMATIDWARPTPPKTKGTQNLPSLTLPLDQPAPPMTNLSAPDGAATVISDLLGPVPIAIDELVRQSAMPASEVHIALTELELTGRIERHAGAKVSLRMT